VALLICGQPSAAKTVAIPHSTDPSHPRHPAWAPVKVGKTKLLIAVIASCPQEDGINDHGGFLFDEKTSQNPWLNGVEFLLPTPDGAQPTAALAMFGGGGGALNPQLSRPAAAGLSRFQSVVKQCQWLV